MIKDKIKNVLKKITKTRKRRMFVYACIVLITFQATVSLIHRSRYYFEDGSDKNYCCVEMSRDCEMLFERLGVHTTLVSGIKYDYGNMINVTIKKSNGMILQFFYPEQEGAHEWVVLQIGPFSIPYESTWLLPFDPQWRGYEICEVSEGYCIGGKIYADEQNKVIK